MFDALVEQAIESKPGDRRKWFLIIWHKSKRLSSLIIGDDPFIIELDD